MNRNEMLTVNFHVVETLQRSLCTFARTSSRKRYEYNNNGERNYSLCGLIEVIGVIGVVEVIEVIEVSEVSEVIELASRSRFLALDFSGRK